MVFFFLRKTFIWVRNWGNLWFFFSEFGESVEDEQASTATHANDDTNNKQYNQPEPEVARCRKGCLVHVGVRWSVGAVEQGSVLCALVVQPPCEVIDSAIRTFPLIVTQIHSSFTKFFCYVPIQERQQILRRVEPLQGIFQVLEALVLDGGDGVVAHIEVLYIWPRCVKEILQFSQIIWWNC